MLRHFSLSLFLRLVATVSIFIVILSIVDFQSALSTVLSARPWVLMMACLAMCAQIAITILRWQLACLYALPKQPYRTHLEIQLVANFIAQVLPSHLGIEGVRIWLLGKRVGSFGPAAVGAISDRLVALFALTFILVASAPFRDALIPAESDRTVLNGVTILGIGISIILISAILPISIRLFRAKPFRRFQNIAEGLHMIIGKPSLTAPIFFTAIAVHATTILVVGLFLHALGTDTAYGELLLVLPAANLTMLFPISLAGWGLREGAFAFFLGFVGVPIETSVAASVLFGLAAILLSLPGGLLILWNGVCLKSDEPPQKAE